MPVPLATIEAAGVGHAEVTEREVVLHGINRIQLPKRRRDVLGHPPAGRRISCEPQTATDPDHVSVERDNQRRRIDARPDAEIECVAANHPAQEEIEALAGTPARRPGEEIGDSWPRRYAAIRAPQVESERLGREPVEGRAEVRHANIMSLE